MKPVRKACLEEAARIWADQPSLGLLETANEVRVTLRGRTKGEFKDIPGAEAIRKWLVEAVEAGVLSGSNDDQRLIRLRGFAPTRAALKLRGFRSAGEAPHKSIVGIGSKGI